MKTGTKKFLYTILAVVLALGLGIGAILLSMLNVQASTEMMPGIEQILDEKSEETPFRILELVNNSADAEIGYYISGQEPYLSQYKYTPTNADGTKGETQTFSSVEEGLSVLPTKEKRQEFVKAKSDMVKNPLASGSAFAWNADSPGTTSEASFPLSFKSYEEKYFLSKTDDASKWNRVDLKESRKETLTGHYEENTSGKGDYTKEEQKYYPIREDVKTDGSTTQKYRENIKNFFYSDDTEASAPYQLSFEEVNNEKLNNALKAQEDGDTNDTTIADDYDYSKGGFGYYENVYGELTSQMAEDIAKKKYTFPGENPVVSNSNTDDTAGSDNSDGTGDATNNSKSADGTDAENEIDTVDTDGLVGGEEDGTAEQSDVTTAGTQMNPYIYRGENIEEHPYYKYTLLGDLKYVKEQAEKNKDTSQRKDGDITVEDGQYWYWSAESTDNGDESDTDSEAKAGTGSNSDSGTGTADGTEDAAGTDTADGTEDITGTDTADGTEDTTGTDTITRAENETDTGTTTGGNSGNDTDVTLKKEALYIVTGRQAVSQNQVKSIPEDFTYNYYYKVKSVDYCTKLSKDGQKTNPEDYTYYGWYYASHPSNEDTYIEVNDSADSSEGTTDSTDKTDGTTNDLATVLNFEATHYISEAQYTLTPGKGNYDFIEGRSTQDTEQSVEIDHLFYQGGYTNHDWFKHYVFHLDPDSEDETIQKQFKNFSIKIDTKVINENGTGTSASELPNLDDYDLVYINGKLTSIQAEEIASTTKLPAIINQKKALATKEAADAIDKAFAAYVDEDYANTSYVAQRIYFTDGDLCNLDFPTNFSEDAKAEFSEITKYIESENNYREVVESGEQGEKTELLSKDISQARVIEYIINYKYKRQTAYKKTVNVLDIEPASATASLTEDNVKTWLGLNGKGNTDSAEEKERGTIRDFCCQERKENGSDAGEKSNGGIDKILDGDANTYWHSLYSNGIKGNRETPHWFEYKLSSQDRTRTLTGIRFTAKSGYNGGGLNGRPYKLKFEVHKLNGKMITETATFSDSVEELQKWNTTKYQKEYTFKNPIKKVDYIKVIFEETYSNPAGQSSGNYKSTEFATCAEFSTLYQTEDTTPKDTTVNITHMTSSEFVGHIDDINTEYDAIYFGDSYTNWDFRRNGDVTVGENENTSGKKVSLYSHSGGVYGGKLDRSYNQNGSYFAGMQNHRWNASRLMGLLDIDYAKDDNGEFILKDGLKLLRSPNNTPGEIGEKIGRMRGSGNDITKQQLKELKDFVSSGYPVIIGNKLLNNDGTSVNTDVVDSSSYIYEFLEGAIDEKKDRVNVMSKAEADKKQNLNFFFYMAKPEIDFSRKDNFGKMPPEPKRLNDKTYKYNKEADWGLISQDEDGLVYEFRIKNDSEISTANATYNCELFIDLNFDGNLSSKEEQSEYMQIQDENNNVVKKENGKYHLKLGKNYTLTRKIPKDYYKVITWKIQISNNDNSSIRTSRMGFTKREAGEKKKITVLQIHSEPPRDNAGNKKTGDSAVTWYLDKDRDSDFDKMLSEVGDFDIDIKVWDTRKYESKFKNLSGNQWENVLNDEDIQMIIIGFSDGFGIDNIDNSHHAVDAIRKFIEEGKSVIFSHDTTSFVNTTGVKRPASVGSNNTPSLYNPSAWPILDPMPSAWDWGYSLNTFLRAKVGMDRYGITSDEKVTINGQSSTVSKELKKGNDLKAGDGIFDKIQKKVADMAYVAGDKTTSSLMTQGFSNNVLDNQNHYAYNVTKVNEGAITQYPNYISDLMPTSRTHSQYYQLAMEEDTDKDGANDIVVWYCLSGVGGDDSYKASPNDVRNNYYFYSKGNVIYTGVGDSGKADAQTGEITKQEKELFVNAIVAAANVTAVDPEATFLDDFDPVSNQEDYRYYMPDRLKASEVSGTSNILDGDNNFNIRIRDYNMVAANLNSDSNKNNAGSLTMELYIEDPDGTEMEINKEKVKVKKISVSGKTDTLKKYSDGQTVKLSEDGKFKLPGNDTFQFSLKDMESYLKKSDGAYKKECRIFAKVESSVTLYGTKSDKTTWTSISLKPRQLFDLD